MKISKKNKWNNIFDQKKRLNSNGIIQLTTKEQEELLEDTAELYDRLESLEENEDEKVAISNVSVGGTFVIRIGSSTWEYKDVDYRKYEWLCAVQLDIVEFREVMDSIKGHLLSDSTVKLSENKSLLSNLKEVLGKEKEEKEEEHRIKWLNHFESILKVKIADGEDIEEAYNNVIAWRKEAVWVFS